MADCRVKVCDAITCKHNKDRKCMLSNITINSKGVCEQFTGSAISHTTSKDYHHESNDWKRLLREREEEKEYRHPRSPHKRGREL
tara:strand:- start:270 stop:524 length:255 start_codon:yes stop_codon:yes gene_type:complete